MLLLILISLAISDSEFSFLIGKQAPRYHQNKQHSRFYLQRIISVADNPLDTCRVGFILSTSVTPLESARMPQMYIRNDSAVGSPAVIVCVCNRV